MNVVPLYGVLQTKGKDTDIKLADFGFAKEISERNGCRTLCGTPGYLAPEILERWPAYDTKCDLWSVGVILFLLLGGYLPFEDDEDDKVFDRTRNGQYGFDPAYWRDISGNAKELVTKLLTIKPNKRLSATEALQQGYMVEMDEQPCRRRSSANMEKLKASLTGATKKIKAAVAHVVEPRRLEDLNEGFKKYLEHKRGDESSFKTRPSMNPNAKSQLLESEEGQPFDTFYSLGELVSFLSFGGDFTTLFEFLILIFHALIARRRRLRFSVPSNSQEATIRKVRL